jgi:hypothetical protein
VLGIQANSVVGVAENGQDVAVQARGVCEEGKKLRFLLVCESVDTVGDVSAVRLEIDFTALYLH